MCVASVHSLFNQSKDEMTRRIVRAMENPHVHVIGHPTGRIINKRQPVDVVMHRNQQSLEGGTVAASGALDQIVEPFVGHGLSTRTSHDPSG